MSRPNINATAASLLGFLHAGPMTGWDLDQAVRATISNFWNVTRSQVYRELRTLAELGYVEVGEMGPRDRRPYSITPAGREVFAEWIARDPGPPIIRMPLLLTVFFADHLPSGRLVEITASERKGHVQALEEFRALYEEYREKAPFVAEVIRFGIGYHELVLSWLEGLPISDNDLHSRKRARTKDSAAR
jgi:DNA-binding PadR family transcriptional regulator